MERPIILIGGGGHCKSVIEVILSTNRTILGILDCQEKVGQKILEYSIVGTNDDIHKYIDIAEFIISVGQIQNSTVRRKIDNLVASANGHFTTVIASSAIVSQFAEIGVGSVIMHNAVINAAAKIGAHSIINTMANIGHDVNIGDFCHISTGAMVSGDCQIGNDVFIGSQSVLRNQISVTDKSVISAASFVNKTIVEPGVYCGVPARLIKKI